MPLPKQGKKIGNCGNAIAENGREKKLEWNCIFFVNCGNVIAENGSKKKKCGCRNLKRNLKKNVLRSQYFHNKSQVISYYQFKFEFNTEITFLIQQ